MPDEFVPEDEDAPHIHFPEDMPDQLKEQLQRRFEMERIQQTAEHHSIYTFLDGLDEDELLAINVIFQSAIGNDDPSMVLAYYQGFVRAFLSAKHGVCPACSKNHTAELTAKEVPGADDATS